MLVSWSRPTEDGGYFWELYRIRQRYNSENVRTVDTLIRLAIECKLYGACTYTTVVSIPLLCHIFWHPPLLPTVFADCRSITA